MKPEAPMPPEMPTMPHIRRSSPEDKPSDLNHARATVLQMRTRKTSTPSAANGKWLSASRVLLRYQSLYSMTRLSRHDATRPMPKARKVMGFVEDWTGSAGMDRACWEVLAIADVA